MKGIEITDEMVERLMNAVDHPPNDEGTRLNGRRFWRWALEKTLTPEPVIRVSEAMLKAGCRVVPTHYTGNYCVADIETIYVAMEKARLAELRQQGGRNDTGSNRAD